MPLVSVVLPTYNRSHILMRTIRSVVAQTLSDWELIVVDDGSTDGTGQLCERLQSRLGRRLRYVFQRNSGASAARNHGLELATGKWIAFADSDDVYVPNKLLSQIAALEHSSAKFSFTGIFAFDDAGNILEWTPIIHPDFNGNIYPRVLELKYNCVFTPTVIVERDLARALGGFDVEMAVCEDIDFWARISRNSGALALPERLTGVHVREPAVFPYVAGLKGRLQLYNRALDRDPSVWAVAQSSIENLIEMFVATADQRRDLEVRELLMSYYNAARLSGDWLLQLGHAVNELEHAGSSTVDVRSFEHVV